MIDWINRNTDNHVIKLDNASTSATGRGAGDDAIRNQASFLGQSGVNVVIVSNDTRIGAWPAGAAEPTITQNSLANSLLVSGAISANDYFDYIRLSRNISMPDPDNLLIENIQLDLKHPGTGAVAGSIIVSRQNGTTIYFDGQSAHVGPNERVGVISDGSIVSNRNVSGINPNCFVAGTLIPMAGGTEKPIEQIEPGDRVLSFDPAADGGRGKLVPKAVTKTFRNLARQVIHLRGVECTPGHIFLTGETDAKGSAVFKTIAAILREDGTIVDRDGARLRARTGSRIGSAEDTPIRIVFGDPETGRECVALVRAGVPTVSTLRSAQRDGGRGDLSIARQLAEHGFHVLADGRLRGRNGALYDSTDWPQGSTPFDTAEQRNWVVLRQDGRSYTPPWITGLVEEDERVGLRVAGETQAA